MPKMHLVQPRSKYSACGKFPRPKERIQKVQETGDSKNIFQNKLDKSWSQHDMVYGNFKDLPERTASDKVLYDKAINIAKNLKYDGYERVFTLMVSKPFDQKSAATCAKKPDTHTETGINSNSKKQQLAE